MSNHSYLDSHQWLGFTPCPWSEKQRAKYQAEIDAIVGVEPDGTKRFRLAWLPEEQLWNSVEGRWEPEFRWGYPTFTTQQNPAGLWTRDWHFNTVPRFAIKVWQGCDTPAHFRVDYEDEAGRKRKAHPVRPIFALKFIFGAHAKYRGRNICCDNRAMFCPDGFDHCYGKYVEPSQDDLDDIRREMKWYEETFENAPNTLGARSEHYAWLERKWAERDQRAIDDFQALKDRSAKENFPTLKRAWQTIDGERHWSLPSATQEKTNGTLS